MKLRLSVWAEDLPGTSLVTSPDPFAVVTVIHKEKGSRPTIVGKTETIPNSYSPDWTKQLVLEDFELGKSTTIAVSLYDGSKGKNKAMGSTIFDVGAVLGARGNVMARDLKQGGFVAVHVEPFTASARLSLQLRCLKLTNLEGLGLVNKSDPFFEIQRIRESTKGSKLWDTVYRSSHNKNDLDPIWPEAHLDLGVICGNNRKQKMRIVVYDHEGDGKHECMGSVQVCVDELVDAVTESALAAPGEVNIEKALELVNEGKQSGSLIVAMADLEQVDPAIIASPSPAEQEVEVDVKVGTDEPEIMVASASDELVAEPSDLVKIPPTFVNFVAGGCQLNVSCAIDCTSTNGDPRESSSLHYFTNEGKNSYETALFNICSILSQYDSDQKYPLFGFGAKREGTLNHCFPFGEPASEVSGILDQYRKVLRAGVVMSSPREFAEVIRNAGEEAKNNLVKSQSYSILLIFTNGPPASLPATKAALEGVKDHPLSVVIVGVGSGDFGEPPSIKGAGSREFVQFVAYDELQHSPEKLAVAALGDIPLQLQTYFQSREIFPNPEVPPPDIAVAPYEPAEDIEVPIQIDTDGTPTVTGEAHVPPETGKIDKMKKNAFKFGSSVVKKVKRRKAGQFKRRIKNEVNKLSRQTLGMRIV